MLNQSTQTKVTGTVQKTIVMDSALKFATSVRIGNAGVVADGDGKKIIKAGMPLTGDLLARDTAFVVAATTTGVSNAVAICQSDIDVTSGTMNGSVIVFGFIDESKLDAAVVTALDAPARAALKQITFLK